MTPGGANHPHLFPHKNRIAALALGLLLSLAASAWNPAPARAEHYPVRLGINIAGSWHMLHTDKLFYQYESWFRAVNDLGAQFIDVNFLIKHALYPIAMTEAQAVAQLKAIDQALTAHGLQYTLSVELANWKTELNLAPRPELLNHADGTHRLDLPMSWLNQILPPQRPGTPGLLGINFDEGEHNQLQGNLYVFTDPPQSFDRPYYLVTDGMTMKNAFDALAARAQWLKTTQYQGRLRAIGEQVWPDMFHIFARAGWTIAPKILQENFAPVMLSAALGAALQYQDAGADLWVLSEISRARRFPGWPPSALRSALLMSYWVGASTIFVENLDFSDSAFPPHLLATQKKGALLWWDDPDHYGITKHGLVVQDFFKNYVPAHPRPIHWRDYRPRVAIVRLPDGCTARPTGLPRDRLLGRRTQPSDAISGEWLKIWPILTHKVVRPAAAAMSHMHIYPDSENFNFFVPIDSVAVFDHTVRGAVLDSVRCFVVCGHELSRETFDELKGRAATQGVQVIIARRLYNKYASGALAGKWLIVDDFADPRIWLALQPFLGPPDVARFRFKDYVVEFRPTVDRDTLEVSVKTGGSAADVRYLKLD